MKHVGIRTATMDDYEVICGLLKVVDEHHVSILPDYFHDYSGPARPRDWVAGYVEGDEGDVLLAEADGRVVGCVMLKAISLPECPRFVPRRMAHVEEIVVARECRRAGVGTALMEAARRWACDRGLGRIQLGVWASNSSAVRFYKKRGFKTITARMELDLGN